ncbi:Developmental regulator ULTRAPETALA [Euphorbia peplus]|nr:Developmental regulator ULTRAPETALA [Euphorbia peplus]
MAEGMEIQVNMIDRLFAEETIQEMAGYNRGSDYVEVKCGCTSRRYGDTVATLQVHANGKFVVICECSIALKPEIFTPPDFEKHADKAGRRRWQSNIWVLLKNKKVPLWRTPLLKYYKHEANGASMTIRRKFHRDEFITCSICKKQRRFQLRTEDQIRAYHDALLKQRWKCSDRPSDSCADEEERASRRNARGCPRSGLCKGCTSCVCFGCLQCRFFKCDCRTCADYMYNAEP